MSAMFEPMRACSESAHNFFDQLRFPLMASAKLDGIRATVRGGVVYARSNKPFPNPLVQAKFKDYEGVDGEFVLGDPTRHDLCRATGGVTNSHGHAVDDLKLFAFDHVGWPSDSYLQRLNRLKHFVTPNDSAVVIHEQNIVWTMNELLSFEKLCLEFGYEGVILRSETAPYKFGRSTAKEQYLLKLKRFEDAEGLVIGFEERMHNGNEATVSELGRTKRSSHKAGKSGRGDLGALIVRTPDGVEFNIGTGFDDSQRDEIWRNRTHYLGKFAKYKHFAIGAKTAPRHPVFLSWRDMVDM